MLHIATMRNFWNDVRPLKPQTNIFTKYNKFKVC